MKENQFVLGGGVTGLAAALSSKLPVLEAMTEPGGICSSYYVRPGSTIRLPEAPADGEAYRFEIGGGHWIFGGDPTILHFINKLTPVRSYARRSSVYFAAHERYVPYPLQNHLRFLGEEIAEQALKELVKPAQPFRTMKEWLTESFGPTLGHLFFYPFHDLYTSGLYEHIAPQDAYKSPVDLTQVIQGTFSAAQAAGYNVTFVYPIEGLNTLAQRMADFAHIAYNKRVVALDTRRKKLYFQDGGSLVYDTLLSTLPLNKMMLLTDIAVEAEPDPYTSVLVLNIGAVRGRQCPDDHWLYNPDAKSGFHRVGFYSNVDASFLPQSTRADHKTVSIYVERAYAGGTQPTPAEVKTYCDDVVAELQSWGFIEEAEVVDPTWIEVAYTWAWPASRWKPEALRRLQEADIYQVGRYGRWVFQGIADSIRDGFYAGSSMKSLVTLPSLIPDIPERRSISPSMNQIAW
ncbi:MAG: FAD-dependent oxidoreductase [Chloroflexi bacterium]|nr:FAD-dependent oxidoreductase [Chloroflexota bacterium]MBP8056623.1 FAD-dependent oxidoreductase [Chloroflexota bacterium]